VENCVVKHLVYYCFGCQPIKWSHSNFF